MNISLYEPQKLSLMNCLAISKDYNMSIATQINLECLADLALTFSFIFYPLMMISQSVVGIYRENLSVTA